MLAQMLNMEFLDNNHWTREQQVNGFSGFNHYYELFNQFLVLDKDVLSSSAYKDLAYGDSTY